MDEENKKLIDEIVAIYEQKGVKHKVDEWGVSVSIDGMYWPLVTKHLPETLELAKEYSRACIYCVWCDNYFCCERTWITMSKVQAREGCKHFRIDRR